MNTLYRWSRWLLAALVLSGCAATPAPTTSLYEASAVLGDEQTLRQLYSWPNSAESPQSLTDTIHHYTWQSGSRDGLPDLAVTVWNDLGTYTATIRSSDWRVLDYGRRLPRFLAIGQLGVDATTRLKAAGLWNDKEWRFFLPLGLALTEQRSVQLLHFPPDHSLPDQDYLGSQTSQRWEALLQENGVSAEDVPLYEAIVDIAPIAAPASAGSTLEATYPYYAPYARRLLKFLLQRDSGAARPVVAYGYPVRQWLRQQYGTTLKVLDTAWLDLGGSQAAVIAANHPSFIWYAKEQGFDAAEQVMYQDLVAACWQATMGNNPDADAALTRDTCRDSWRERPQQVCVLTWQQAFDKSAEEAHQLCRSGEPTLTAGRVDLETLERQLLQ
ncbi:MAG: hypothetical protein Kow0096_12170 [Thiohalomonadaceae bacterium]